MEKRWVKKEDVEKQLYEIVQLMQQVDEKIGNVIEGMIHEQYEQSQTKIEKLELHLENIENRVSDESEKAEEFQQQLPLPTSVSSKLNFV
ncbi:hypothetical protein [Thermaerobacillus caldiproteolyticus]|uniref:Uncharacterized protein YecA (UPF0149 family) n=1 Tax=Thermaerobacillus caldiproteolyticus TaxID=247480 RepID=A0A7V9Z6Q7_9BACL|nr:hypothetical protein [Anoxybacillus caldiproteolyticus]MBA2875075.1 uncharacterized protein YecA (UPF0149 family) [Anoxybacillus caldiproteolyticus]